MRARTVLFIALVVAALIGAGTYFLGSSPSSATPVAPKTAIVEENSRLIGEWKQYKNGIPNSYMSATIAENTIKVVLRLDSGTEGDADAAGTFWIGSFDTSKDSDHFKVESMGDKDALTHSILGSQDRTKSFYYDNGILSFNFSIMGVNTTVQLVRE